MLMTIMIVQPVGESTHADPDAFEHAVASELVHDERGLHPARLLVRVGHDAPDEVKMLMLMMMTMMMMMMMMMMHLMKCGSVECNVFIKEVSCTR